MKKIFLRVIFSLLLCVAFLSFKTEEEEESESYRVDLPSSVGSDELSGTKWEYFDKKNLIFKTWVFENGAATYKEDHRDKNDNSKSVIPTKTFFYSYTTSESEKLLYLRLEKIEQIDGLGTTSWTSGEEYCEYFRKIGNTQTNALIEYFIEGEDAKFYEATVFHYKLSGSKITLTKYFTGSLPTGALFAGTDGDISIKVQSAGIFINNAKTKTGYTVYPRYDGKDFSGKLFKVVNNMKYSVAGDVRGFYSSEAKGKSGSLLYLTFTSLPDGVSEIELNKAYCVNQRGSTYVFEQAKAE